VKDANDGQEYTKAKINGFPEAASGDIEKSMKDEVGHLVRRFFMLYHSSFNLASGGGSGGVCQKVVHCQAKCRDAPRRGESGGQEMALWSRHSCLLLPRQTGGPGVRMNAER